MSDVGRRLSQSWIGGAGALDQTNMLISVDELSREVERGEMVIFDCRFDLKDPQSGESAWRRGHIPGARYAHLDRDLADPALAGHTGRHPLPDPARFIRWLGTNGVSGDIPITVYDDSGGAIAVRLWWLLRFFGHREVFLLDGGFSAWCAFSMPVSTEQPAAVAGRFHGVPGTTGTVDAGQLAGALGADQVILVDARDARRYRGEVEPIDREAGHVPGAVNMPFSDNLDEAGRFRPAAELELRFKPLVDRAGRENRFIAHMCGSGVTACHNMFAMEVAGLESGRLYVGSWSDWITDPSRPRVRS